MNSQLIGYYILKGMSVEMMQNNISYHDYTISVFMMIYYEEYFKWEASGEIWVFMYRVINYKEHFKWGGMG